MEYFFSGYGAFNAPQQGYWLGAEANRTLFFTQYGNSIAGPALVVGTWHHVAVSTNGATTLHLAGVAVSTGNLET